MNDQTPINDIINPWTEIAGLRAELAAARASHANAKQLWENTEADLAAAKVDARETIDALRAELAKLNKDREYEIGCLYKKIDALERAALKMVS